MAPFKCYLWLFLSILISNHSNASYTEYNFTIAGDYSDDTISSGKRILNGIITIPDMFIKPDTDRRRLKEIHEPTHSPNFQPTPAPTKKLTLPVILLIHPEGAQDRNLTLYGSQFDMDEQYNASIFHQLKEKLVTDGHMAVIQYDKRSCKSPQAVGLHNYANISVNYTGEYGPICEDQCPSWCINKLDPHNIPSFGCAGFYQTDCYNDTNITINDIKIDANRALNQGIYEIKRLLNSDIINTKNLWKIPLGYSAQGASIASYIASTTNLWFPTAISLMGSGVDLDELLVNQLQIRMKSMNKTDEEINMAIDDINTKFMNIRDGTLKDKDTVEIDNDFLDDNDIKHVKYWKDWLDLSGDIKYDNLENFLAINSRGDNEIDSKSFKDLGDVNVTMNMESYTLTDVNHWMINTDKFETGEWEIDDRVSEHIITFLNDISGYKDNIERYIRLNRTNVTVSNDVLIENDMVYKVLLYLMIMAIVMILSLGIYCVVARKVCPLEFQDDNQQQAEEDALLRERAERERRRRRRRRHRERRRRSSHSSQSHHNSSQSQAQAQAQGQGQGQVQAAAIASPHRSRSNRNNNNNNDLNEPMLQRVENVLMEEIENNNNNAGIINHDDNNDIGIGNGVINGDVDDPLATSTQMAVLNEYVD